jgi:hypothetical protein
MTHCRQSTFMWGRLATCGRVALGLGGPVTMTAKRVNSPPQVDNLPHKNEHAFRETR